MNKTTFVILSISSRIDSLNLLVESIRKFPRFDNIDINLIFQDNLDLTTANIKNKHLYANIFV